VIPGYLYCFCISLPRHSTIRSISNPTIPNRFLTQQALFHDQAEETDGDEARQREGWPAGKGEAAGADEQSRA